MTALDRPQLYAHLWTRYSARHWPRRNCLGCGGSLPENVDGAWYAHCTPRGLELWQGSPTHGTHRTMRVDWPTLARYQPDALTLWDATRPA